MPSHRYDVDILQHPILKKKTNFFNYPNMKNDEIFLIWCVDVHLSLPSWIQYFYYTVRATISAINSHFIILTSNNICNLLNHQLNLTLPSSPWTWLQVM